MRRAWPRWFVAKCVSYPSTDVAAGRAMIPALSMRMSSLSDAALNVLAASCVD